MAAHTLHNLPAATPADGPLSSPFGQLLRVQAALPYRLKGLPHELRRLEIGSLDIRNRGSAADVETRAAGCGLRASSVRRWS